MQRKRRGTAAFFVFVPPTSWLDMSQESNRAVIPDPILSVEAPRLSKIFANHPDVTTGFARARIRA